MLGRANTAGTGHSQRTHVRKHITDDFVAVFNFRLSLESLDPARASCETTSQDASRGYPHLVQHRQGD
jgi:hypothetical protein